MSDEQAQEARSRKRQRSQEEPPLRPCDRCRIKKIRCSRQEPDCFNCRKAGSPCIFSGTSKRVNQTKELYVQSQAIPHDCSHCTAGWRLPADYP
ncbi:hypothetical protein GQ53DRAFT_660019 [Thozetella sp. PMI_491]|nr:hypothetical protein GQ53DRAFT_660019 [Thozetella sp. PMI_491]